MHAGRPFDRCRDRLRAIRARRLLANVGELAGSCAKRHKEPSRTRQAGDKDQIREEWMNRTLLTRRTVLQATAATALTAPFVQGAYAAGKLSFGVWDHWVPGTAEALQKICAEWGAKEKVDVNVDLITSNGDKDLLTLMAEGQAKAGHDMMGLRTWYVSAQADNFVPVDDIVLPVIKEYGPIAQASEYTGKIDGHWMAVPT